MPLAVPAAALPGLPTAALLGMRDVELWGINLTELWAIPWVQALIITLGAALAGLIFDKIVARFLLLLTAKTKTDIDDRIVETLHKPIFWTVTLIGAAWAIKVLGPSPTVYFVLFGIIKTVAVLVWTSAILKIGTIFLSWIAAKEGKTGVVQPRTLPLFDIGVKVVITFGAIYAFMLAWNINISGWLASAGIIGLAIGFAAKDTLANLFAGVFILADGPYKLGDYVVLGSGERGKVVEIGMRSTRILTRDDIEIVVPNSAIANGMIVNESGGPAVRRRIRIKVGVAYGSDVDLVRRVLLAVANEESEVTRSPYPRVRFRQFGDSSLDFELMVWIDEPEWRGRVTDKLNTAVYKAFAAEGIQIPFPQRDVHLIPQGSDDANKGPNEDTAEASANKADVTKESGAPKSDPAAR